MLKITLPPGAEIVAIADDVGIVITGKILEEIQRIFGECYEAVQQWIGSVVLKLTDHKTEAVFFTSRKQVENITLDVGQCTITSQSCIRYLGEMLDARLSFKPHVEHAAVKAAKVVIALTGLMPNVGGPRQPRRKLLASVVISILTYGIAIWGEALKIKECRRKIAAVNRLSALTVSCAFRTVSDEAVCVIAGMMPIEVLSVERKQLYEQRSSTPEEQEKNKKNMRHDSLQRWQREMGCIWLGEMDTSPHSSGWWLGESRTRGGKLLPDPDVLKSRMLQGLPSPVYARGGTPVLGGVRSTRRCGTCILLVPALHWREELETGRHTGTNTWARNPREIDSKKRSRSAARGYQQQRFLVTDKEKTENVEELNSWGRPCEVMLSGGSAEATKGQ